MSRFASIVLGSLAVLAFAAEADAQAHVVQLPSFSYFTTNTSVLVPDGGAAYLGGVNRAGSGSTSRGIPGLGGLPFGNRGSANYASGGGMQVTATIQDLHAMDEALLAQTAKSATSGAADLSLQSTATRPVASLAEIRQQQAAAAQSQQAEAEELFNQGVTQYDQGKLGVAKIYLQMAARRATGDLLKQVQSKLQQVTLATRPPQVSAAPSK
jgi:hypothetical protein